MTNLSEKAQQAKVFIETKVKNKIFIVVFIKADGTQRRLRAQYGVHVGVKGTGHKNPEHLIKLYDHDETNEHKKFKSVNLETIQRISCGKLEWNNITGEVA